jgi:hypothetical protein
MIVEIEIGVAGGHPFEIPAHPLLVGGQFLYGPRDTAIMVTSRCFRCTLMPLKPSARMEQ